MDYRDSLGAIPVNKPIEDWPDLQRAVGVLVEQVGELETLSSALADYMACRSSSSVAIRGNTRGTNAPIAIFSIFTGTGNDIQAMQDATYRIRSCLQEVSSLVHGKAEKRG